MLLLYGWIINWLEETTLIKDYISKVEAGKCSAKEIKLIAICLILIGVVIGMILAPAKVCTFGSFNGNSGSITAPDFKKKKKSKDEEVVEE